MEEMTVVVDGEYLVFTNNSEYDCKIDVYYGYESSNSKQGKRFLFSMTERQMIIKNPDLNHRLFFLICPKEGKKCETKINQNVQKKTNLKTSLNNLEKIE